jgi:hypothetical protein
MIQQRLGSQWEKLSRASIDRFMNDDWEHGIKRNFDGKDDYKNWAVTLPPEAVSSGRLKKEALNSKKKDIVNGRIRLGS